MSKDILSEFGPDSPSNQRPRATGGGAQTTRDVHNYKHPVGPTTFSHQGPGLAAHTNHDNCGTQGKR